MGNILKVVQEPRAHVTMTLTCFDDGNQHLDMKLEDPAVANALHFAVGKTEEDLRSIVRLAVYDARLRVLRTYPRVLKIGSSRVFDPKHSFDWIEFEGVKPVDSDNIDPRGLFIERLPTGFHIDPFEGLGLHWSIRQIFEVIEGDLDGIVGVVLCDDPELSFTGGVVRFPKKFFDQVRRAINRAHAAALDFANEDKLAYLRGEILRKVLPAEEVKGDYRLGLTELRELVSNALYSPGVPRSKRANEMAAVRTVRSVAKKIATENPAELYELTETIELVTLDALIEKFVVKLGKKLTENHWQKFLIGNHFILRAAFALPMTVFGEQVSVGGTGFRGGGKIADFVVRSGLMGNVSIIEIKKPSTQLLMKDKYRGKVFAPSSELSGSIVQVSDQRFRLQQEINNKKASDEIHDVYAYAVSCLVIAGKTPDTEPTRKSFEMFRSSLNGVTVVTFDELLEKLKFVRDVLKSEIAPFEVVEDEDGEIESGDDDTEIDLEEDIENENA